MDIIFTSIAHDVSLLWNAPGFQDAAKIVLGMLIVGAAIKPIRGLLWPLALSVVAIVALVVVLHALSIAGLLT